MGGALAGLRVLVAENEYLIAAEIERILIEQGCTVLGPVRSVERALARIEAGAPDLALLNAALRGRSVAPVVAALRLRGVPLLLVTGYVEPPEPALRDVPRVEKPFLPATLVAAVAREVRGRGGASS